MSEASVVPIRGTIPEFDLADRLRKALRVSGMGAGEIAEHLGVERSSVSNWLSGRIAPRKQTLMLWAQLTGVDFTWLTGDQVWAPSGSNRRPRDYKSVTSRQLGHVRDMSQRPLAVVTSIETAFKPRPAVAS